MIYRIYGRVIIILEDIFLVNLCAINQRSLLSLSCGLDKHIFLLVSALTGKTPAIIKIKLPRIVATFLLLVRCLVSRVCRNSNALELH